MTEASQLAKLRQCSIRIDCADDRMVDIVNSHPLTAVIQASSAAVYARGITHSAMFTPSKYWRVPCELGVLIQQPPAEFSLPESLTRQTSPPSSGHGVAIAAYDESQHTGLLQWVGVVLGGAGVVRTIEWRPVTAQIWVDTPAGRNFWKAGAFGFAKTKSVAYGLHELWQESFDGMVLRDNVPQERVPIRSTQSRGNLISAERLNPIEVIGEPASGARAGVVYVLKSAYGYKVGRTRNVPARMRAFGVHLPIIYTIPLCAWFDDCHYAEKRYHDLFASKRINGEWFDLTDIDIQQIRERA